jgi:hypothetical protein
MRYRDAIRLNSRHDNVVKEATTQIMKSRLLKIIWIIGLTVFIGGCAHYTPRLVNLTPELMTTNPSGIYTLTLLLDSENKPNETKANVVIGGAIYAMVPKTGKNNVLTFDYSIPSSVNRAKYYYEILDEKGKVLSKTEVFDLRLTNRYVVELESVRAQPGEAISVLGKGFRAEDKILFDDKPIETRYVSENQLEFDVPVMRGGEDYRITLQTAAGSIAIGTFRIDYSEMRSMPSRLVLLEGQTGTIVFTIDKEAPVGGVPLSMKLNPPNLLEFDEASIAEGTRSVNLQVMGGAPGKGILHVQAAAHNEIVIPVEIQNRVVEITPVVVNPKE